MNMTPQQFTSSMKGSILAFTVYVILFGFDTTNVANNLFGRTLEFAGWELGWALFTLAFHWLKQPVTDFFDEEF